MATMRNSGKFLDKWTKKLQTAAKSGDLDTVNNLMVSMYNPVPELNPIRIAEYKNNRSVIPLIVRVMRQTERLDALAIAERLFDCYCQIKYIINPTDVDVVQHMIRLGAPVTSWGWRGDSTALHEAVKYGDSFLTLVQLLLDNGAPVNCLDDAYNTPLLRCLDAPNSMATLRLLVSRGARADFKGGMRKKHLFKAISNGHPLEAIELLLGAGANVQARGIGGLTALQCAAVKRRRDILEYLLDLEDQSKRRTVHDRNILHLAFDAPVEYLRYLLLVCGFRIHSGTIVEHMCTVMRGFYGSPRASREEAARKLRFSIACGLDVAIWHKRKRFTAADEMWVDALVEQVAVREFLDLKVDARCARMIYGDRFCLGYVVACKDELAALMELRFYDDVTLFNVLTDSDARMRRHVLNEELVAAFRRICEEEGFLIYRDLVIERFDNFLYLSEIREKALSVLDRTMHGAADCIVVRLIAKQLSDRDLFKLSKFYEE